MIGLWKHVWVRMDDGTELEFRPDVPITEYRRRGSVVGSGYLIDDKGNHTRVENLELSRVLLNEDGSPDREDLHPSGGV